LVFIQFYEHVMFWFVILCPKYTNLTDQYKKVQEGVAVGTSGRRPSMRPAYLHFPHIMLSGSVKSCRHFPHDCRTHIVAELPQYDCRTHIVAELLQYAVILHTECDIEGRKTIRCFTAILWYDIFINCSWVVTR
jgi:hypothetical protein